MVNDRPQPEQLTPRDAAVRITSVLRDAGHVAYLAGGCVRDALMGVQPKDYDIATDARPERVQALFANTQLVGESFGVVLVRIGGQSIEVATFRLEWGYEDGRRPTAVHFTDAEHDARRRDFSINGMFEDPLSGEILDYVNGRQDLANRVIRAIGDPRERFNEDYLRLLRAVRFAARLNFEIEERTADAIVEVGPHLAKISRERIGQEMQWMLMDPSRAVAGRLLASLRLDAPALSETMIDSPLHTLLGLDDHVPYPACLAAWMLDRHAEPDSLFPFVQQGFQPILRRWRGALCLSNEVRDGTRDLFIRMEEALRWKELPIARKKRLLASPCWEGLFALLSAMQSRYATHAVVSAIVAEQGGLLAEGVAPPPLVTGDDLIALGFRPGPDFRRWLEDVYDEQLEGRLTTHESALAWLKTHCI